MACPKVHQGGCNGEGLTAGAVVMVGGGFCVSEGEGEAGVGKSYGRARRGASRLNPNPVGRVQSLAETERGAPCSLHVVVVPSALVVVGGGGGTMGQFDNS
jgi:hypothetical protein